MHRAYHDHPSSTPCFITDHTDTDTCCHVIAYLKMNRVISDVESISKFFYCIKLYDICRKPSILLLYFLFFNNHTLISQRPSGIP